MESQKGKCTHHSDCEFDIYKDDLCILHCEKTGKETDEEVSQFHETLLRYSVRDILNNSIIMSTIDKIKKDDLMNYLRNPYDFYSDDNFQKLYILFSRISVDFYNIKFPKKYNYSKLNIFVNKAFNSCEFLGDISVYDGFSTDRKRETFYKCKFYGGVFILNIKFDNRNEMINRNREENLLNYRKILDIGNLGNSARLCDLILFKEDNLYFQYCEFNNVLWIKNSNINSSFLLSNNLIYKLSIKNCNFINGYKFFEIGRAHV